MIVILCNENTINKQINGRWVGVGNVERLSNRFEAIYCSDMWIAYGDSIDDDDNETEIFEDEDWEL